MIFSSQQKRPEICIAEHCLFSQRHSLRFSSSCCFPSSQKRPNVTDIHVSGVVPSFQFICIGKKKAMLQKPI
ncbi:uncharacterized protein L203_103921 [Cryptococcus depauperatus CBS 7841]|uniref:Uncharacterized protein n=1 Tax=Cryptococcus depauperatus CBS 7841 TaxID=1295531 RepID=A0AAJ8M225_9TREE